MRAIFVADHGSGRPRDRGSPPRDQHVRPLMEDFFLGAQGADSPRRDSRTTSARSATQVRNLGTIRNSC
jgi:hypothetical protein